MAIFYAGITMTFTGWVMISFFGASPQEFENGKQNVPSDVVASFLLLIGALLMAAFAVMQAAHWIWPAVSSLFYDMRSIYRQMSVWERCQVTCRFAADLFFLSMFESLYAEVLFWKMKRHNPFKAQRVRESVRSYARAHYVGGLGLLAITMGLLILKTL